jgi:type II secretory pathway pseudopilin PulG
MAYCAYCGSWVDQVSYVPCASCAKPTNGAPARVALPGGRTSNLPLVLGIAIGIFVVIGIAGILAAIAIPNLLTAMQRAKQKRTMADIRSLATSLESYAVDNNDKYPVAARVEDLSPVLEPKYATRLPRRDAWEHELRYVTWTGGYAISSGGSDGVFEHTSPDEYTKGTTQDFDCDLVYANGEFIRYPGTSGR